MTTTPTTALTAGPTFVTPPEIRTKTLILGLYGLPPEKEREIAKTILSAIDFTNPRQRLYLKSSYDAPTQKPE